MQRNTYNTDHLSMSPLTLLLRHQPYNRKTLKPVYLAHAAAAGYYSYAISSTCLQGLGLSWFISSTPLQGLGFSWCVRTSLVHALCIQPLVHPAPVARGPWCATGASSPHCFLNPKP